MKCILAVSVAIVAIGSLSASRPMPPDTRNFVYGSAQDGGGGESITRNGDMISGDMAIGAKHVHYEGRIAADGTIPRLDMRVWRSAAEAKHPRVVSAVVGRDTTRLIQHLGSRVDTLRFASQAGMLPLINPSIGLLEVLVEHARTQKSRPVKIPALVIDALDLDSPGKDKVLAGPMPVDITFLAADTVMLGNPTSRDQMRLIIGPDGRCRGAGNGSTAKDKFSMRPTSKPMPPSR